MEIRGNEALVGPWTKLEENMLQTIQPFLGLFQTIPVSNESMHCKTLNAFASSEFKSSLAYRRITDKSQSYRQHFFNSGVRSQCLRIPFSHDAMLFQGPNFFSFERTSVLLSYYFCRSKQKCGCNTKNKKSKNIDTNKHFSI